ncbi:hypothetical protein AGMMS50239_31240 [Bacteroidia bacterium]|nr:hypothetical protein AGMMS50239_31240 [Bacteroidia bacterium]
MAGKFVAISDILNVVQRDKDYYDNSGGGVTFSGGEAFVQFDGLMELLSGCKKAGIHTAIETCGQVAPDKIKQAFPLVDLFLFDIKHTDKDILKKTTGADLDLVLDNLRFIAANNPEKVIIRVPVIPGFNNDLQEIENIFNLALRLNVKRVDLLPYHVLGKTKYEQLGRNYSFPYDSMLPKEALIPLKEMGEKMGLEVYL